MSNYIETTTISPSQFVPPLSRYIDSTVIYYGENKLTTFTTYLRTPIVSSPLDKYMVITKGVEYRPDLVSFSAYGTCDLWWRILEANQMLDIYDFKAGVNIVVPNSIF